MQFRLIFLVKLLIFATWWGLAIDILAIVNCREEENKITLFSMRLATRVHKPWTYVHYKRPIFDRTARKCREFSKQNFHAASWRMAGKSCFWARLAVLKNFIQIDFQFAMEDWISAYLPFFSISIDRVNICQIYPTLAALSGWFLSSEFSVTRQSIVYVKGGLYIHELCMNYRLARKSAAVLIARQIRSSCSTASEGF